MIGSGGERDCLRSRAKRSGRAPSAQLRIEARRQHPATRSEHAWSSPACGIQRGAAPGAPYRSQAPAKGPSGSPAQCVPVEKDLIEAERAESGCRASSQHRPRVRVDESQLAHTRRH